MSGLSPRGKMGAGGEFRFITHDVSQIKGTGPDGEVTFEDLWDKNDSGHVLKRPDLVRQDIRTRNKFTKRGLSRMMHETLKGHGGTYTVPGITVPTDNPFVAFCLFADSPNSDGKDGDARPEWNESDGTSVAVLSADTSIPGEGRRGILLSTTSGNFRRISLSYKGTNPYGEAEMIFYSPANTNTKAAGTITFEDQASCADAEYFILNDGLHTDGSGDVTFEIDKTGDGVTAGRIPIDISGASSAADVRAIAVSAVNGARPLLKVAASDGALGQMDLAHLVGGARCNNPYSKIDITNMSGGTTKADLAGGTASGESGSAIQLDNFMIKGVALTEGVACGAGEANSGIGVRAIVGLAPTIQGRCQYDYAHEWLDYSGSPSTRLIKYNRPPTANDTTSITADGYVVNSSAGLVEFSKAEAQIDSTMIAHASNIIDTDAGTAIGVANTIRCWNAPEYLFSTHGFVAPNLLRKTIRIVDSDDNDGDYTIKRCIDRQTVEVYEDLPGTNETGATFTVEMWDVYTADRLFDGRVENEGRVEPIVEGTDYPGTMLWGGKYVSADDAGPHGFGRIWNTTKTISSVKIIIPAGSNRDFTPDFFKIDILPPTANSSDPRPGFDDDWVPVVDHSGASQDSNIFDAGAYGYTYSFTPIAAKGVRISGCVASGSTRKIEVAQFLAWGETAPLTMTGEKLMLKISTGGLFKEFTIPDLSSVTTTADIMWAMNEVLRGWQMEAFESNFGYLWLRSTVAGANSELLLDSEDNGSTGAQSLGLTASAGEAKAKDGITQVVRKNPGDAMTMLYRINITGNVPGGWI